MVRDATEGIRGCGHCRLAKIASHESQSILNTMACDTPFDVVFLDYWLPGELPDKDGNIKLLTAIDSMTGYAMGAFVTGAVNAETTANAALASVFIPFGLPRMNEVDADGIFA